MLNKTAEKVLKCIIKKSNGNIEKNISISDKDFNDKAITISVLLSISKQLYREGYVVPSYKNCIGNDKVELLLKYEGYSYFDNKRTKLFWKLFPIIISLAALLCTISHVILDVLGVI